MRVDLDALASFSQMGDEGGDKATDSLETLTGMAAHNELSRTTLVDRDGLRTFLGEADTRIAVGFDGALSGRALVSYDDEFAAHAADQFPVDGGVLEEVSNILTSGFVDIWAADADTTIDVDPPEEITNGDALVQDDAVIEDCAFVFESYVSTAEVAGDCRFAVVPDVEPFLDYLSDGDLDTEQRLADLSSYIRLTAESADAVATHLAAMLGADATTVESHLDLVPVERVPSLLDDTAYEGAIFESEGVVDSVIAVLFDEDDAELVADELLGEPDPDQELTESAVAELGNITASGFLDQWANALETTIDISTPAHVHDDGSAVLDTVAAAYGRYADTITVVDATVDVGDDLTCRVVAFPSPEDADAVAEIAAELSDAEVDES